MSTCHITLKTLYVSSTSAYGLFFSGRKYDYFLTFYPQPNQWWILDIYGNELNPPYLFPKWKPIWKIRLLCFCETGDEGCKQNRSLILWSSLSWIFFLSNAFREEWIFFFCSYEVLKSTVKSLTNNNFTLYRSSIKSVMENYVIN